MGTSWAVHPCDHMTHCCCPALQESILILITSMKKDQNSTKSGNWYFQIVVLEKTLEHPLDCKEIKLVNPKGNQPWIFIGRTDAEAEAPILWPFDAKSWLTGKELDTGKDWRQEEKDLQPALPCPSHALKPGFWGLCHSAVLIFY